MQATRQHILDYLDHQQSATSLELSRTFGNTVANIRHHLSILSDQGYIRMIDEQSSGGRGRPEKRYALIHQKNEKMINALASILLEHLKDPSPGKRHSTRLKKLANSLAQQPKGNRGNITQMLVESIKRLDELGYRPSWEARPGGPEITLGQCPYAQIIDKHPELCQMDKNLLESLTNEKISQNTKLETGPKGLPQCIFALQSGNQ
jgi:predicted ArsR family transcriptional regulator